MKPASVDQWSAEGMDILTEAKRSQSSQVLTQISEQPSKSSRSIPSAFTLSFTSGGWWNCYTLSALRWQMRQRGAHLYVSLEVTCSKVFACHCQICMNCLPMAVEHLMADVWELVEEECQLDACCRGSAISPKARCGTLTLVVWLRIVRQLLIRELVVNLLERHSVCGRGSLV